MTDIFLLLIFFIPAMLGLAEMIHTIKSYALKPEKPVVAYKVIFLTDDCALMQLKYILEQYIWLGRKSSYRIIVVNSFLNDENYRECKSIAEENNLTFCSVEELSGYFNVLTGE